MRIERRGADDGVREALDNLRQEIDRRVRTEQLCDQLTRLPNEAALNATIDDLLGKGEPVWLAFFEIDRFKWINDKFGYQSADALLQRVAGALEAAQDYFSSPATAFRPHGDEFYLLGARNDEVDDAALESTLDLVRQNISALRVSTPQGTMQCTASVGWVDTTTLTAELTKQGAPLTKREILGALELAVGEAKWQKDCVVRFTPELKANATLTLRDECQNCRCKFQVNIKRQALPAPDRWCCPSCGTPRERPPVPALEAPPQPDSV